MCRHTLNETLTYKDIVNDLVPNSVAGASIPKLPVRDWAPLIPSVQYQGYKGDTFQWFVPNKLNGWYTYIKFDQYYDLVNDSDLNANEASRLLLWASNLRLYCGCPSFSYHGFAYILTSLDAAIYPEERFPKKNNPELLGWGCKHLRRTAKVLGFHLGNFASSIKQTRMDMIARND